MRADHGDGGATAFDQRRDAEATQASQKSSDAVSTSRPLTAQFGRHCLHWLIETDSNPDKYYRPPRDPFSLHEAPFILST